jgi:hypothetical protein
MPKRFSAKVLVKYEGDSHRSAFRLRFLCLSFRDLTADPQRNRAGLISRTLPVELGLIVGYISVHFLFVFFSKGQNFGDEFQR